jgi:hypothetical protein
MRWPATAPAAFLSLPLAPLLPAPLALPRSPVALSRYFDLLYIPQMYSRSKSVRPSGDLPVPACVARPVTADTRLRYAARPSGHRPVPACGSPVR